MLCGEVTTDPGTDVTLAIWSTPILIINEGSEHQSVILIFDDPQWTIPVSVMLWGRLATESTSVIMARDKSAGSAAPKGLRHTRNGPQPCRCLARLDVLRQSKAVRSASYV
jgi:hypothetical protein